MFDAQANQYPRIKATLPYAIWKRNLFLIAGADDLVNYTRARAGGGAAASTGSWAGSSTSTTRI